MVSGTLARSTFGAFVSKIKHRLNELMIFFTSVSISQSLWGRGKVKRDGEVGKEDWRVGKGEGKGGIGKCGRRIGEWGR
jgi:hypothetical protein